MNAASGSIIVAGSEHGLLDLVSHLPGSVQLQLRLDQGNASPARQLSCVLHSPDVHFVSKLVLQSSTRGIVVPENKLAFSKI